MSMEVSGHTAPGAADLSDIKKQCARRLLDRLRDPQVRAEKGSGGRSGQLPLELATHTPTSQRAVSSEGRLGVIDSALSSERHRGRNTQGLSDSGRSRPERSATQQIIARNHSAGANNRRPWGWQGGASTGTLPFTPRTPTRSSRGQPTVLTPSESNAHPQRCVKVEGQLEKGHVRDDVEPLATTARRAVQRSPRSREVPAHDFGEKESTLADLGARHGIATEQPPHVRSRSPGTQMSAALALRRLVALPTTLESNKCTTSSEHMAFNATSARYVPRAASAERLAANLKDGGLKGQEDVRQLAGTLQRLCELEDERRRVFEEYDGMFVRAATWTRAQSSPAKNILQREKLHAADDAAGGAHTGSPKSPKSSTKTPKSSIAALTSTDVTPSTTPAGSARKALSAASERADAQLTELLRKSNRLRSLLADVTSTP